MAELMKELSQRWLNFSEAEKYSGLSESTLRRLIDARKLRVFRPTARKVLIDRGELDALIESSPSSVK
jgi:excisionase family DNA binding protein